MTRKLVLLSVLAASPVFAADYYVSTTGSDSNPGTLNAPFASIEKARDTIRALKNSSGLPNGGVTVWLRGGEYFVASTVSFDARDSGTSDKPVVYRSYTGEEAKITGAKALPASAFKLLDAASPVWARIDAAAKGNVYVADLKANGFTNFGTLRNRGFSMTAVSEMELVSDDNPMTLARWPNAGEAMVKSASAPAYNKITFSGTRPSRWASLSDVWVHGCLANTWTDFHMKVSALDNNSKTITFTGGPGSFACTPDQPYYYYNILEELDQAGEYYIDRTSGLLYYWPKSQSLAGEKLRLSVTEANLFQFSGTSQVKLLDLVFQNTRGGLVNVASGDSITMEECVVQNAGTFGVSVNGSNILVTNCDITNTGEDGVILQGGDRASLTPGNNAVTNSRIHRTSRISWTFHPAVNLVKGCGNRVANNLIDDLPHSGIVFSGNNHIMELNEIREVCKLTSDTAAVYAGTDWGYRGNVIRNNLIHNVWSSQEGYGAHGVYLDDCMSGVEVTGNIIYNVSHVGVLVGGGRDNIIKGNIIARCSIAHSNDDRGRIRIVNTAGATMNMLERLTKDGVNYQAAPWTTAYPALAKIPNSWSIISSGTWRNPENCVLDSNIGWSNSRWTYESNTSGTGVFSLYASMANNATNATPLFSDAIVNDRAERPASLTASVTGFNAIPFYSIGRKTGVAPAVPKPPASPAINTANVNAQELKLEWSNRSNLPSNKVVSFQIERRNLPDGSWASVTTLGEEVGTFTVKGLAPETSYQFRVIAVNAQGTAASNVVTITTGQAPYVEGTTKRYEAEDSFTVLNDVPTLRKGVDAYDAVYDSKKSLRIYDPGDKIRIPVTVSKAGLYRITYRGTSGGAINNTSFWPNGYLLDVDGVRTDMHGDMSTLSPADNSYGNVYWGSMKTAAITLAAGSHNLDITSGASWAVADYIEITPIQPPVSDNYTNWAAANFASDQNSDKLAVAAGDGVSNLMKYSLGLAPWTKVASLPITAAADSNRLALSFTPPSILTDVAYTAEVSEDAQTWVPLTSSSSSVVNGLVRFIDDSGAFHRYIRLRVTCGAASVTSPALTVDGLIDNVKKAAQEAASQAAAEAARIAEEEAAAAEAARLAAEQAAAAEAARIAAEQAAAAEAARIAAEQAAAAEAARIAAEQAAAAEAARIAAEQAAAQEAARLAAEKAAQEAAQKAAQEAAEKAAQEAAAKAAAEAAANTPKQTALTTDEIVAAKALTSVNALANVSSSQKTTLSLVMVGSGSSKVLVRNSGPALAKLGVSNSAADPSLVVYNGNKTSASNNDWTSTSALSTAISATGAMPFAAGSKDAAAVFDAVAGQYDAIGSGTGLTLLEGYRFSSTNAALRGFATKSAASKTNSVVVGFTVDSDEAFNIDITLSTADLLGGGTLSATLTKDGKPVDTTWTGVGAVGASSVTKMVAVRKGVYTVTISNSSATARDVKLAVYIKAK